MNLKDILNNNDLNRVDKEIYKNLEYALNSTKLELKNIGYEKYLKKASLHGADLIGSSLYYSLFLYFFNKEVISGFRENLIGLVFVVNIQNLDDFDVEVSIESVYEIKHKRINLKDFKNNSTNDFFCEIINMLITSVMLFLEKELSENGVVPKKFKMMK